MPEKVDTAWAKKVLSWWVEHADDALRGGNTSREFAFCRSGPKTDALLEREHQTQRVLRVVLGLQEVPALVRPLESRNYVELQNSLDLTRRALGRLATDAETEHFITGTAAPTMAADSLHSLVWDAAEKLWHNGHYGQAVQRAATFLNAHIQDLTGRRDVSDNALMAQVFSLNEPEPGKPRLRWPGEDSDLTVKAMRSGLLQFSQGSFMAIRNPVTHGTADVPQQEALEHLAVLSTLVRWVDECILVEAEAC